MRAIQRLWCGGYLATATAASMASMVTLFGLSMGRPSARDQTPYTATDES